MKVNVPVRFKNPWFWVGVVSVAITAIGVDPVSYTHLDVYKRQVRTRSNCSRRA